jgi:hypothetical protein
MSAKRHPWQDEIDWATAICAPLACTVELSAADYEIAKVNGAGVSLVIYPHKTSARNHHARVRDNGSKDKRAADRVMQALHDGQGLPQPLADRIKFSCTFSQKNAGRIFRRAEQPSAQKAECEHEWIEMGDLRADVVGHRPDGLPIVRASGRFCIKCGERRADGADGRESQS